MYAEICRHMQKLQMRTEEKDMSYNIAVIPGDGIGPEIVREAQKVLDAAGKKYGFELKYTEVFNGRSIHRCSWCASDR